MAGTAHRAYGQVMRQIVAAIVVVFLSRLSTPYTEPRASRAELPAFNSLLYSFTGTSAFRMALLVNALP